MGLMDKYFRVLRLSARVPSSLSPSTASVKLFQHVYQTRAGFVRAGRSSRKRKETSASLSTQSTRRSEFERSVSFLAIITRCTHTFLNSPDARSSKSVVSGSQLQTGQRRSDAWHTGCRIYIAVARSVSILETIASYSYAHHILE